jgi:hypothetical protein
MVPARDPLLDVPVLSAQQLLYPVKLRRSEPDAQPLIKKSISKRNRIVRWKKEEVSHE